MRKKGTKKGTDGSRRSGREEGDVREKGELKGRIILLAEELAKGGKRIPVMPDPTPTRVQYLKGHFSLDYPCG